MKTVLLFGGNSGERLVSVASAQNLAQNYDFSEIIYLHKDGALSIISKSELIEHQNAFQNEFKTSNKPFATNLNSALNFFKDKIIFLALHGTEGEDGKIQELFESAKICFTGSGSTASKNAFEKDASKKIIGKLGLTLAPEMVFTKKPDQATLNQITNFFKQHQKIVFKPVASGSSIGLHIISNEAELKHALEQIAKAEFDVYLAEKFLTGRELTAGVIDRNNNLEGLLPSEVVLNEGNNFDYEGKYLGRGTTEITPAKINADELAKVKELALASHRAFGCYGYSRTDMILVNSQPIFMETNTLPGLTKASFIPQQLHCSAISMNEFIASQLELARKRYS